MQLIIDVTRIFRYRKRCKLLTGIDRVTVAYVRHYGSQSNALVRWCGKTWLFSVVQSQALFKWLLDSHATKQILPSLLKGICIPHGLHRRTPIFLLNTGHVSPAHQDYARLIRRWDVKPIFFVHDLIPIHYPEYCFVGEDIRHRSKINYVLDYAYGVITNSAMTLKELDVYCAQQKRVRPVGLSAWLGSSFVVKNLVESSRPIEKPYFVLNCTIEPRKNHLLILHIWRNLCQMMGDEVPHLFVIGKRGWECEQVIDMLERSVSIQHAVTEVSNCTDQDLVNYIQHSQAVLMPSFAEGFGLGLVEAFAHQVPVIASDLPVFREIAQDVPEYAHPIDGMRWQYLIGEYAKKESLLRQAQLKRLNGYQPPSWTHHFEAVDAFLSRLI